MKKSLLILIIAFLYFTTSANAEKIPVKISPTQLISTHHDEIEIGDYVNFKAVNDVYKNGNLFIKAETPIVGVVGFVHENGFAGDKAEIIFDKFLTKTVNDKNLEIKYTIDINGNSEKASSALYYVAFFITGWVRGAEINIEPNSKTFNLFIEE